MNQRQAKIEALSLAVGLLQGEVNTSNEMYFRWGDDGEKVHDALEIFIYELSERVDRLKGVSHED